MLTRVAVCATMPGAAAGSGGGGGGGGSRPGTAQHPAAAVSGAPPPLPSGAGGGAGGGGSGPSAKEQVALVLRRANDALSQGNSRHALLLLTQAHCKDPNGVEPLLTRAKTYQRLGLHAQVGTYYITPHRITPQYQRLGAARAGDARREHRAAHRREHDSARRGVDRRDPRAGRSTGLSLPSREM